MLGILYRLAAAFLPAACLAAPFVWLSCAAPIAIGVLQQAEPPALWSHLLGGAAGLSIAVLAAMGDRRARAAASHPLPLCILAFASLGAFAGVVSGDLPRSLSGGPGFAGALWYAELAALTMGCIYAPPRFRRLLAASALLSVGLLAVMNEWSFDYTKAQAVLAPYNWMEYMAWFGLLAAVPVALALPPRLSGVSALAGLAVFGLGVAISYSKLGHILAVASIVCLLPFVRRLASNLPRWAAACVGPAIAVVVTAAVYVSGPGIERSAVRYVDGAADSIPATAIIDHVDMYKTPGGTIWSRSMMWRAVAATLSGDAVSSLTGRGFGDFPDVVAVQSRSVGGRAFDGFWPGAGLTYWDARGKAELHSHSAIFEGLLAAGPLGALLTLALTGLPAALARRRDMAAAVALTAGLAAVTALWFPLNSEAGLLAVALGAVSVPAAGDSVARRLASRRVTSYPAIGCLVALSCVELAVAASWAGAMQGEAVLRHVFQDKGAYPASAAVGCGTVGGWLAPGKQLTAKLFLVGTGDIASSPDPQREFERVAPLISRLSCATRKALVASPDADTLSKEIGAYTALTNVFKTIPPAASVALARDVDSYQADVDLMLSLAPGRTDLLGLYYEWAAHHGRKDITSSLARRAASLPPGDPVALWIRGRDMYAHRDKAGKPLLERALAGGFDDIVPIGAVTVPDLPPAASGSAKP